MAVTWAQVCQLLARDSTAARASETMWRLDIPVSGARMQKVYVAHRAVEAGYAAIQVSSGVSLVTRSAAAAAGSQAAMIAEKDILAVLRDVGTRGSLIGGLSYADDVDGEGIFMLYNVLPLRALDLTGGGFEEYLGLFAAVADEFEKTYARQYGKDGNSDIM